MRGKDLRIVFMGTPEFAVPCLEKLISDGHNVKGVFTQPDKPKGRGHKIQFPPVKECALNAGIPVYHINELEAKIKKHNVRIGILTVPIDRAQEVADKMIVWGIKAIWNFTPLRIRVPENIVVQNTSLYAHLSLMFNRLEGLNVSEEI